MSRWLAALAVGISLVAAGGALLERSYRVEQTCIAFERQHAAAMAEFNRSRDYLRRPARNADQRELKRQLAPLIRANLPQLRSDARANRPPDYCA